MVNTLTLKNPSVFAFPFEKINLLGFVGVTIQ